ncbi:G-rich sequence factor 1 isoform X1 [Perognathus longimembris pacificus]|uniref:G-rich sequence factor 1 isoform X1 n=1 Tax=Perognathus longimembris pacificus TaxID=214514 RepID=UPI002019B7AE|nr:G-rich sequence factor 1 isoform X1 [Perognathus longimembris pacificus]XP_048220672.1 G-rich sequence factor 1 isoform X1 [Perognathus longimembris pacificus]
MAGTRWVLGALLRGCGCNCSSCRRTGAACLPFYSAAGSFPSGVSGRRRLLLLLGAAAAAAASQTRGLHSGPAPAGRLAGLPPAPASYAALRAPLLPQALAATAAAGPARAYGQESKTSYLEDLPPLPEYELSSSKIPEEVDDVYLIRAQGLPWSCTVEDVLNFFSDCRIRNSENGIHFLLNRDGKRRGDALIEMESEQDVQKALEKHRMYMGQRYVEVYEINNEDVDALMKNLQVKSSPAVNDGVVRLRGLPYSCNEKDIVDFFAGLNIVDITFVMDYRGRRKTGEAYVQFEEPEMATRALLKHREEMGNRYIEIFPSRRNEVRTHVGSHKGKKMASSPTTKYITEPEMVFEEHEVNEDIRPMTAFESEKEMESPKEMSEKLPEAVDFGTTPSMHFVHMRGLPFQANAQDIINFFAPLKPVRITMEYSSSGKATGEADVHFDSHEDAVAAMLKDRSHVQHRYIELFLNSCPKGK